MALVKFIKTTSGTRVVIFHNLTREFIDNVISVISLYYFINFFCLYNKKNITRRLEDMNFIFEWQKQYFIYSLRSFVKYCFATRK